MESPAVVPRDQLALQQRCLQLDTSVGSQRLSQKLVSADMLSAMPPARAQALCDDVENVVGDVLCDGFDELEAILAAEETVALAPEKIREVRACRASPRPRARSRPHPARPQGVDRVMYKFQKHAVDNCRVFKSYTLQQIFGISPQVAERSRAPAGLQPSAPGVHTSQEEEAIDAELAQLRERAHAVRRPARIALVVTPRGASHSPGAVLQSNAALDGLQQEESALSQQLEQSSKRLEWLSSLSSSGARQPVAAPSPGTHERAGVVRSDAHAGRCGGHRQAG